MYEDFEDYGYDNECHECPQCGGDTVAPEVLCDDCDHEETATVAVQQPATVDAMQTVGMTVISDLTDAEFDTLVKEKLGG